MIAPALVAVLLAAPLAFTTLADRAASPARATMRAQAVSPAPATMPGQGTPVAPIEPLAPVASRNMSEIPPEASRLIDQVMSPFCPGLILTNCPTLQADSLRKAIRTRIASGATRAEVLAELERVYGDAVRSAPDRSGFGLTAWVVPGAAVLGALLLLVIFLRRSRRAPPPPSEPTTPADPGDDDAVLRARLAARLREG